MFNQLGPFPYVFRKVKELLLLELHEMVKVPHVVACQLDSVIEVSRERY